MVDQLLKKFAHLINHLDECPDWTRENLLHPKLRSWITGVYPKNPTSFTDDQWHLIWRMIDHRALEFHTDYVHAAENGREPSTDYDDEDHQLWTLWFNLAFPDNDADLVQTDKGILGKTEIQDTEG